jgi:tetratricopeptide (TPR) repeat protein
MNELRRITMKRTTLRTGSWALVIAVVGAMAPALAHADEDAEARKQSKVHFQAAERFFKAGKYQDAITEYGRAYEILPLPAFLFNIGQCHRNLKNWGSALSFFEDYLSEAPNSENRAEVEQLIKQAKAEQAKSRPQRAVGNETPEVSSEPSTEKPPAGASAGKVTTDETPATDAAAVPQVRDSPLVSEQHVEEESPVYERWWFWTAIAVAVVAVAGGTAIALSSGGHTKTILPQGSAGTIDWR